jgi:hypothetical protein
LEVQQMRTRGGRHAIGVIVTVVVLGGLFAGLVFGVRAIDGLGFEPPAQAQTVGASITLSAFPDSTPCHGNGAGAPGGGTNPAWVTFCPTTTIKIPAYAIVTVTIDQYDTATPLHNPFFARVTGTIGNVMYVNGRPVSQISPNAPAHTFTIQSPPNPNQFPLFVSVPLPGVANNAPNTVTIAGEQYPKPNVIVFRFRTGAPGQYLWKCYVPCGTGLAGNQAGFGGPMATIGYMAGTLTVT